MGKAVGATMTTVTGGLAAIRAGMSPRMGVVFHASVMCMPPHICHLHGVTSIHRLGAHHARHSHAVGEEAEQQGKNEQIAFHA